MPIALSHRRRPFVALLLIAVAVLVWLAPSARGRQITHPTPVAYNTALNGLENAAQAALEGYMVRSSPADPRYYANGVWYANDGPSCWFCYDSAGVAAATLSQLTGNASLGQVAIDTFNHALSQYQLPSGGFADIPGGPADGVNTGFFTVDLGVAYLEMRTRLSPAARATWSTAIAKAASYLISSGDTTWYINGNVNLRQTEVMWLAWAATRQQRFLDAYNSEWAFTISPPQSRWRGYGLHYTRTPTLADGSNGSGYLAESNGGTPGFDGNYTDAQLDTATDLYVLTHDPRYLRLMNLEFNQLRPLISASWILDALNGSRDSFMDPFNNPALSVLAASGDRPDLVPAVTSQLASVATAYSQAAGYTSVNFYKGFESWLSMPLLNRQWPAGMAPATAVAASAGLSVKSHKLSQRRAVARKRRLHLRKNHRRP
jgi:hypothetical protein